jgi:hypothetical protein
MSESAREPIGLPPRRASGVQNLLKSNREAATGAPVETATPTPEVPETKKLQVTFYMLQSNLKRAKAAFKATSGAEMDDTWSDFISRAVMNEVTRREQLYNSGEPYQGGDQKLAPGRKIAS